jgi:uncharacterized tellurite resistance protein B-like protein
MCIHLVKSLFTQITTQQEQQQQAATNAMAVAGILLALHVMQVSYLHEFSGQVQPLLAHRCSVCAL